MPRSASSRRRPETMGIPEWIRALSRTTLRFWDDPDELTWGQANGLLTTSTPFYVLARESFAERPALHQSILVFLGEALVALAVLLVGPMLGPIEKSGPRLVRLLMLHIMVSLGVIGINYFWPYALAWPVWKLTGFAAGVTSTLFTFRTWRLWRRRDARFWLETLLVAVLVGITSWAALRFAVLPEEAGG